MLKSIAIYYLIINIIAFFLYGLDKWKARKNVWRLPEITLLLPVFAGGGIGAFLGMLLFRHKTRHWKFKILVPLSFLLHIVLWVYVSINF